MSDNDEMIALLRLYGNVSVISECKITFWKNTCGTIIGHPTEWYFMVLEWMEDTVNQIEIENKRDR